MTSKRNYGSKTTWELQICYSERFRALLSQTVGIFEIRGHLAPIAPPREIKAPRAPTNIKFGIQVDFGLFYLKFSI